jgi:hypothetical protein
MQSDREIKKTISLGIFLVLGYLIKVKVMNKVQKNANGA